MGMSGRVLIIDTSATARERIASILGAAGLRSVSCDDIGAACKLVREERPRLVLLDVTLTARQQALCRQLRNSAPEYHLPLVLLLPHGYAETGTCLSASEADDFICAPFQDDELLLRVLRLIDRDACTDGQAPATIDYSFLAGISALVNADLDTSQVLQQVVAAIGEVIEVQRCSITMVREDEQFGYVMASSDDPELNGLEIRLEKYPEILETIRTGKPILIDNVYRHPLMEGVRPYIERLGFNSLLVLPMVDRRRVIGVLVVRTARGIDGFSAEEISFCQLVTNVATSALRHAALAESSLADSDGVADAGGLDVSIFEKRGALLNMAAHDLRVLVSVIDGYCLLLQETEVENLSQQQREFVDGLMIGCRRLVELTNNLLDLSRIESGKLELDVTDADLRQVLEAASRDIQPLMRRRGIRLDIQGRFEQVQARCDVENIRRVFYNLMSNAIKFTPQGGTIELRFAADDQETSVSIADSGPGIESSLLPTIFDKFSHGRSPDGQYGSGLGLSICKRIVEAHQGRIWAESILGQGSRFTFCLPRQ